MMGGIMGEFREIGTEGLYGQFEQAVVKELGDFIAQSDEMARQFWSSLANVVWVKSDSKEEVSYSFRAAGDLIAAVRHKGDYLDWYCSGPYAQVADWVKIGMARHNWEPIYED